MSIVPVDSAAACLRPVAARPRRGPLAPELTRLAARCRREFQADDSASDLALEGVALELLATLVRARIPCAFLSQLPFRITSSTASSTGSRFPK